MGIHSNTFYQGQDIISEAAWGAMAAKARYKEAISASSWPEGR
jgi:hypothetical protein